MKDFVDYLKQNAYFPGDKVKPSISLPSTLEEKLSWGLQFFLRAYYWEAHECWEAAWTELKDEREKLRIQALIQIAAAQLKLKQNEIQAAQNLTEAAIQKLKDAE